MANINKRMKQNAERAHAAASGEAGGARQSGGFYTTKYIAKAAAIAAIYIGLTYAFFGLSFEVLQFRVSEAMIALVFFEPAALPGICIGCFISNLFGPGGIYDAVIGTSASALGLYIVRWYCSRNDHKWRVPASLLFYSFLNAVVVAFELYYTAVFGAEYSLIVIFLWVMLGETVCACIGGSGLYYILRKRWRDIIGETETREEEELHNKLLH